MTYDRLEILDDNAKAFTAKATETISGGFLVGWTSGTDSVGSDTSTYAWDDLCVGLCSTIAGSVNCLGIALQTVTSGEELAVLQTGVFILPAGSIGISGGMPVFSAGYGNMVDVITPGCSGINMPIGRAMTKATALTGFAIVRLDL